jgi:hypothetical protein
VGLTIDVQQLRRVDVGVALGRAEAGMTKKFLDRPQVGASLQ